MKKIIIGKKREKRNAYHDFISSTNMKESDMTHEKQVLWANQMYMEESFDHKDAIQKTIVKKINGYKQQDKKKEIYDEHYFIHMEQVVEKIVACKLTCHYCKDHMLIVYADNRDPKQWTLDRIDNDMGHNTENVVISCLQCNLKRRTTNMKKFLFTKQLKIVKKR
jgi:5-methylcytosine-specific restriction endonuclease McrA